MTAPEANPETQRLGCKVGGTFTIEEMKKRVKTIPYEPKLKVVKEGK